MDAFSTHKWKFVLITLLSWTAAARYYFLSTPPYVSEAKLLVRYVIDLDGVSPGQSPVPARRPNGIDPIVKAEVEILTSRDLAEKVGEKVGVDRLASKGGEPADPASLVAGGLTVRAEKESSVIRLAFKHADAETAQATLKVVIDCYMRKHLEIHRIADASGELNENVFKSLALITSAAMFASDEPERNAEKKNNPSFSSSAVKAEVDRILWPTNSIPNIAVVQQPTSGIRDTKRRNQILIGMIAGGPVLGMLVVLVLAGLTAPPRRGE